MLVDTNKLSSSPTCCSHVCMSVTKCVLFHELTLRCCANVKCHSSRVLSCCASRLVITLSSTPTGVWLLFLLLQQRGGVGGEVCGNSLSSSLYDCGSGRLRTWAVTNESRRGSARHIRATGNCGYSVTNVLAVTATMLVILLQSDTALNGQIFYNWHLQIVRVHHPLDGWKMLNW